MLYIKPVSQPPFFKSFYLILPRWSNPYMLTDVLGIIHDGWRVLSRNMALLKGDFGTGISHDYQYFFLILHIHPVHQVHDSTSLESDEKSSSLVAFLPPVKNFRITIHPYSFPKNWILNCCSYFLLRKLKIPKIWIYELPVFNFEFFTKVPHENFQSKLLEIQMYEYDLCGINIFQMIIRD